MTIARPHFDDGPPGGLALPRNIRRMCGRCAAVYTFSLRRVAWLACVFAIALAAEGREFADDLESGKLSEAIWQLDQSGPCTIAVTDERSASGKFAIAFNAGPRARCEVVPRVFRGWLGKYRREPFGVDRWYNFSTYLAAPWPDNEKNEIIAQWHATRDKILGDVSSRGPTLAIRLYGGHFVITQGDDADFISKEKWIARTRLWTGPVVADRWLHWKIQARWSYEEDGLVRIWLNDRLIVDDRGPNTYNDLRGVYLKLGPYHPDRERTMYLDDVYVGDADPGLDAARSQHGE